MNVDAQCLCQKSEDVGDENGQNRHQHLEVVANTSSLQHPSPTSLKPIRVLGSMGFVKDYYTVYNIYRGGRFNFIYIWGKYEDSPLPSENKAPASVDYEYLGSKLEFKPCC